MARRRANGEGSIYRRKDGRYEGAVYVLTTSGTHKRVRVYGATRAEVDKKLTEAKTKNDQGILTADKNWSLGDYLDYWLAEVVKPNRRPATYAQCETIVRLYLKPGLGRLALQRISVPVVQAYLNRLRAEGHSDSKLHVIRKVLSAALTRATREELVNRNVARLAQLPPLERSEVRPWGGAEVATFLRVASSHYLYAAYLLLIVYGLRRGEVLGLRWQDIDVERSELRIRQQLIRVGRQLLIGPLKTRASRRNLPLVIPLIQALHEHYDEQNARGITSELVFTTTEGTPIEPRNFTRSFERLCRRYNLRAIRVHDLRHTLATALMHLNVPARTAQLILGHSRITTTQEIYQHSDSAAKRDAIRLIEQTLLSNTTTPANSDRPSPLSGFVDGNGSRQFSRQTRKNPTGWLDSISGAGTGTLTLDLFHGKSKGDTAINRATEVRKVMEVRRRAWMLGAVAVNLAVKTS